MVFIPLSILTLTPIRIGVNVEYKEYVAMAHDFCITALLDMHRFLIRYVPRVERLLSQKVSRWVILVGE